MKKTRLGVNIDHVATIRNARGENYPEPVKAALIAQNSGADSITIHLREDRRHIKDVDLKKIKKKIKVPLNMEMAPTNEMIKIAMKLKPHFVCIVPENRKEITTEGGLNLIKNIEKIKKIIYKLKKQSIRTSLFIEPKTADILLAKKIMSDCVELHTGKYCDLVNKKKNYRKEFLRIKKAALLAHSIGLEVHAGHGLTYISAQKISKIKMISELNIGHFLISESIFNGLSNTIKNFKRIINK
jgi:pyridoxine 5-phosphate synthase